MATIPGFSFFVCSFCVLVYFVMEKCLLLLCLIFHNISVLSREIGLEEHL